MTAQTLLLAQSVLSAAHDGSKSFPELVADLIAGGFEGYHVDYRSLTVTYYPTDGDTITLDLPQPQVTVAAAFDSGAITAAIRAAQENAPDYSYPWFCTTVMMAGCAGYLVSFPGKRATYYGRTGETHVEHFPQ